MPVWYMNHRISILLFQSVVGVLPFGSFLGKRKNYAFRFILGACFGIVLIEMLLGFGILNLDQLRSGITRVAASLLVFFLTIIVCFLAYEEDFYTALFVASSGYIAQDIAGTFKTVLKLIPGIGEISTTLNGVLILDFLVYGSI